MDGIEPPLLHPALRQHFGNGGCPNQLDHMSRLGFSGNSIYSLEMPMPEDEWKLDEVGSRAVPKESVNAAMLTVMASSIFGGNQVRS